MIGTPPSGRQIPADPADHAEDFSRRWVDRLDEYCALRTDRSDKVARVGPTTPKRAGRLADASVDPTEARKATVRRFGRSHRRAQRRHGISRR
jgi:hypothetical protein